MNLLLAIHSWRNIIQTHSHTVEVGKRQEEKIRKVSRDSGSVLSDNFCLLKIIIYNSETPFFFDI